MSTRLTVIGGGRMGEALLGGLVHAGWAAPTELAAVEKDDGRRTALALAVPGVTVVAEASELVSEAAVIAVKPLDVEAACGGAVASGAHRVLSIAAGVPIARLEAWLGGDVAVVRAMPNTPALVGAGASAIAAGSRAGDDVMDWAEQILGAVGLVVRVPERLLDAVTGLSGSGPAYIFLVVEALVEAGVLAGLPRDVATALARQTLVGSARLLDESGETPEALRAAVTSPGGTTAAGLRRLEDRAVRSAFLEAVSAATDRSRELGEG